MRERVDRNEGASREPSSGRTGGVRSGRGVVKGGWLRRAVALSPLLVAATACERPDWTVIDALPPGGTSSGGTSFASGGTIAGGGIVEMCAFDSVKGTKPILGAQAVNSTLPARRELYAVVTDEEAEALRQGAPLVPAGDPMAQTDVQKLLDKILPTSTDLRRPVIEALKPRFSGVRTTWPNPWALRLVNHAGSEHMNYVRVVLREDAWIARITDGSIAVVDLMNAAVALNEAAANPGRIAAVFYELNQRNYLTLGGDACADGRRELALGSSEMIEQWSLGTEEILNRIDDDLQQLNEFFKVARLCANDSRAGDSFHTYTVCTTWLSYNVYSEYTAYQWALSNPTELYKPTAQNLAGLIEAIQAERFETDQPYVVTPEPPAIGGAGNEGGAAGQGGGAAGEGGTAAGGGGAGQN